MKDIINWLIGVEQTAGALYREAAEYFSDDRELSSFLEEMGEDEALHLHIMGSAAQYVKDKPDDAYSQITLAEPTRKRIENTFLENQEKLSSGSLTVASILECIVKTEFSEWNDMFLYVINTLKEESREFQYIAARMQNHLNHITQFVESRPEGRPYLEKVRNIPAVWRDTFLIVEDEMSLAELLKLALSRQGETEIATNGKQALEKIKEKHFDVIICDIGMPVMNGIEFYQEAVASDPGIGKRFIFYTGLPTPENIEFFENEQVKYLIKPASLMELKASISAIKEENTAQRGE